MSKPPIGTVGWVDLTVDDAPRLRDFYAQVVGWTPKPLSMGDYEDYVMKTPAGDAAGGVCHRRGSNAEVPAGWLPYFVVEDRAASAARVEALGGQILAERSGFTVIRDPAGNACALAEPQA